MKKSDRFDTYITMTQMSPRKIIMDFSNKEVVEVRKNPRRNPSGYQRESKIKFTILRVNLELTGVRSFIALRSSRSDSEKKRLSPIQFYRIYYTLVLHVIVMEVSLKITESSRKTQTSLNIYCTRVGDSSPKTGKGYRFFLGGGEFCLYTETEKIGSFFFEEGERK